MKKNTALDTTLLPLIVLTRCCGFLPNWSDPRNTSRVRSALSWIAVSLMTVLQMSMALFQIIQTRITFSKDSNIHSIALNVIWLVPSVTSLFIQIRFIVSARSLVILLQDWRNFEASLKSDDSKRGINWVRLIYGCTVSSGIMSMVGVYFLIAGKPEESYLLSYYSLFRRRGLKTLAFFCQLFHVFFMKVMLVISDLVPAFFFYHVSLVVQTLSLQIESLHPFTSVTQIIPDSVQILMLPNDSSRRRIQSLRSNYNHLCKFVNKANGLFGSTIIVSQTFQFFFICLMFYKSLYGLVHSNSDLFTYQMALFHYIYNLVSSVLLASHLKGAVRDFCNRFSNFVTDCWPFLSRDDKESAMAFSHELQVNQLAVKPLNLYTVEPKLLLSIGSLITTYVIILLQSN